MAEPTRPGQLGIWAVAIAAVMASSVVMTAIWMGGGVRLPTPAPAKQIEQCAFKIAGASSMAPRLAPDLVTDFLRRTGYTVTIANQANNIVAIQGSRGGLLCSVSVAQSSSSVALDALARGEIAVALSQRPMNERDMLAGSATEAGGLENLRRQVEHVVALDAIVVVVDTENPVRGISVDRLRDITVGVARNWDAVGGPDAPIALIYPRDGNTPSDYPNDVIPVRHPGFESLGERATLLPNEVQSIAAISRNPRAMGVMSMAWASQSKAVRVLPVRATGGFVSATEESITGRSYPIVRRVFMYVRPDEMQKNSFVRELLAFATSEQATPIIKGAGFFPAPRSKLIEARPVRECLHGTAEAVAVEAATRGASRFGKALHFQQNTITLDAESAAYLDELAEELRNALSSGASAALIGHADTDGDGASNREVALRRGLVVRTALERRNIFGLTVESAGERCVASENMSDKGRRANQRVEIWLRKPAQENIGAQK